jgi:transcription antitermination protein NusB
MGKRRQGREAALKLLYALEVTRAGAAEVLTSTWAKPLLPHDSREFVTTLVTGVRQRCAEIDALIQTWSENWSLARIGVVERNILRLAIYELLFMPDIPPNVTINEAVEVAKRYGAQDAWLFINGILDRIKHEVRPQHAAGMLQRS